MSASLIGSQVTLCSLHSWRHFTGAPRSCRHPLPGLPITQFALCCISPTSFALRPVDMSCTDSLKSSFKYATRDLVKKHLWKTRVTLKNGKFKIHLYFYYKQNLIKSLTNWLKTQQVSASPEVRKMVLHFPSLLRVLDPSLASSTAIRVGGIWIDFPISKTHHLWRSCLLAPVSIQEGGRENSLSDRGQSLTSASSTQFHQVVTRMSGTMHQSLLC